MFAGVTSKGMIQIFTEVLLDASNNLVRQDMDPYRIDTVKFLR